MVAGSTDKFSRPIDVSGPTFKAQVQTIASDVAQGDDVECRGCYVMPTGSCTMGSSVTEAATGALILATAYTFVPVANTNMLHFKGTDADKVYIYSVL